MMPGDRSIERKGDRGILLGDLAKKSPEKLQEYLKKLHPSDLAEAFPALNLAQRVKILRSIEPEDAARVIFDLDREMVVPLLEGLGRQRTAKILEGMPGDDAADLLGELPRGEKEKLLGIIAAAEAREIRMLLAYGTETAGGIMTTEYAAVQKDLTGRQAIQALRETAREAEIIYYVYVVNQNNQLIGVFSLRELIIADPEAPVELIMHTGVISVNVRTDQEEVARQVAKYDFLAIPVINDDHELLGIVTIDDILDVIEEEATEDIMRLSGNIDLEGEEYEVRTWRRAAKRLPWLVGLLFGGLMAGNVINFFSGALETMTILAFFIHILAGGPGNAATQSLAVVVRGLATGEVGSEDVLKVIWRETRVGVLIGLVSGVVMAVTAYIWQGIPLLGLVVGLSLAVSIVIATLLGSFIPLIIHRLGIDPALASGPFITTLMDITSMLIYFSLASSILLR
jgi:magnesium transporter